MKKLFLHYWKNNRGLAAIEFAFVMPIMLSMLIGLVELSNALGLRADVINMASTAADLIADEKAATGPDMDNVFNALNAMLYGYATVDSSNNSLVTITISSIIDGGTGQSPKVSWSCTLRGTALTKGSTSFSPSLPSGTITAGDGTSVIWAKVTYKYTSPLSYFITGTQNWTNNFYLKPRRVLQIPYSGTPTSPATCNS